MKFALALYVCLVSLCGTAQNVPNGNFESWDKEDHFVLDEWITYGMAERTTDASSNEYALKLHNYKNTAGNFVSSSLFNVDWQNGSVDKFPFDGNPLSMVFDTKHILAQGDTGYVFAGFYEKGQYIGQANIWLNGSTGDDYVSYSVPIVWYSFSRTPDSVFIGIQSDLKNDPKGEGFITIDDFRFENIGERTVEVNNYDFENWTNLGVVYPNKWMSIDLVSFKDWGGFLRNPSVIKETGFRGNHCLVIQNHQGWERPESGACFTGDTVTDAWRPAFPIDQKYRYLQGYFKYTNGGKDSAEIAFNMFLLGNYLGEGKIRIGKATEDWTFFSIPVTYYADLVPDSATLRIISSVDNTPESINTALFIDDLAFVNELKNTVGVSDYSHSKNTVFPNPFHSLITLPLGSKAVQIQNSIGEKILSKTSLNNNSINLTHIKKGVYFITITDQNNQSWQQKIIKL